VSNFHFFQAIYEGSEIDSSSWRSEAVSPDARAAGRPVIQATNNSQFSAPIVLGELSNAYSHPDKADPSA
jgi:hypothetical protein